MKGPDELLSFLLQEAAAQGPVPSYLTHAREGLLALPLAERAARLASTYLLFEHFLTAVGPRPRYAARHLRNLVRQRFPLAAEAGDLGLLFLDLEDEEQALGRALLRGVIGQVRAAADLASMDAWLAQADRLDPPPALAGASLVGCPTEPFARLQAIARALAARLGAAAPKAFAAAYENLEARLGLCEGFPFVAALLPVELLDGERASRLARRARERAQDERLAAARLAQDELLARVAELDQEKGRLLYSISMTPARPQDGSAILENVAEAIVTVDDRGQVRAANVAARALWGGSGRDLVGRALSELFAFADDDPQASSLLRYLRSGSPDALGDRLVFEGRRADASRFPARLRVAPSGGTEERLFTLVVRDLTEHREAEARLRLQSAALESSASAIAIAAPDGRIQWVNRAFLAETGWTRELAYGRNLRDLEAEPESAIALGAAASSGERSLRREDGSVYVARVLCSPVRDDEGRIVAYVSHHDDVTERRRLEARLALSSRVAALGTLAAGIGHEINNPLAYILGNLDIIASELQQLAASTHDPDEQARFAELLQAVGDATHGAHRVRSIIADLRLLSKRDDGSVAPVDVVRVLESAINVSMNELRHRARVERRLSPVPTVRGSESALGQVFVNLLANAAQALPVGDAQHHLVAVRTHADPRGRAVIEVQDDGPGMSPEVRARIFEPFFTTREVGQGMGLGLSICHGIVTSLGGEIEVESGPGSGTLVRVSLPAAAAPPPRDRVARVQAIGATDRARVLVVDDEALIGRALEGLLRDAHDVVAVASGAEVLARLDAGERPDVLLCDLMMPDQNGAELYAEIERRFPDLAGRVGFITGGAFSEALRAFAERFEDRIVSKPFDDGALRALIARLRRRA